MSICEKCGLDGEREKALKEEAVKKYHDEIHRGRVSCEEFLKAQKMEHDGKIKALAYMNACHVVERNENRQRAETAEAERDKLSATLEQAIEEDAKWHKQVSDLVAECDRLREALAVANEPTGCP